tara:strand:- start:646 stop:1020 length:375 start_codon:yes stop_codon:yes gene_type:complete
MSDKTYNDKMVTFTVLPIIYVWIMASSAVVYTGITRPEIVLENLDGFIALIAIIGGVALPALNTLLRTWESEKTNQIADMPERYIHERSEDSLEHEHTMIIEKQDNSHKVNIETFKVKGCDECE